MGNISLMNVSTSLLPIECSHRTGHCCLLGFFSFKISTLNIILNSISNIK